MSLERDIANKLALARTRARGRSTTSLPGSPARPATTNQINAINDVLAEMEKAIVRLAREIDALTKSR